MTINGKGEREKMKVLLILVDGMRPDALAEIAQVKKIKKESAYTMQAKTVTPPVTLPCHMSLFHSVDPSRHGTITNTYAPQVRPIEGLFDLLKKNGKTCAFFYNWEELRDISRPESLTISYFSSGHDLGFSVTDDISTKAAIESILRYHTDFTFLYLGCPDDTGHKAGWMSEKYMEAVQHSWENIEKVLKELPEDYTVIITADHGGHERNHGTDFSEQGVYLDTTIPVIIRGETFTAGKELQDVDLKDLAPTIAQLLGVKPADEWEGKSLV